MADDCTAQLLPLSETFLERHGSLRRSRYPEALNRNIRFYLRYSASTSPCPRALIRPCSNCSPYQRAPFQPSKSIFPGAGPVLLLPAIRPVV
jgi:hypothetical protein